MSAPITVQAALLAAQAGTLPAGTRIADTSRAISDNLDALQGIAGSLSAISITNGGRPAIGITAAHATADAGVLSLIDTPYFPVQRITAAQAGIVPLAPGFTQFGVLDSSLAIVAALPALTALRDAGRLNVIRFTDAGNPVLSLSAAQVAAGAEVLDLNSGPSFTIALTDAGTPTVTLPTGSTSTSTFDTVIGAITTPFNLAFSGVLRGSPIASIELGVDRYFNAGNSVIAANPMAPFGTLSAALLPGNLSVLDYQGTLSRTLDALEIAAEAGKITTIMPRDGGPQVFSLTPQQATSDALALTKLTPNIWYSQIIKANQAASPPALDPRFQTYTVEDTLANVLANVTSIDALSRTFLLQKVRFTDWIADIALPAAQLGPALSVLSFAFETPRIITLTDAGTPTVTVAADILGNTTVRQMLAQIPQNFTLVVTGKVSASLLTTLINENTKVVSSLSSAQPLVVADYATNIASGIVNLQSLAAAGKIQRIDLLDGGSPVLNLSGSTISASSAALALIQTPKVAGSAPTTTGVSTSASAIVAQLPTFETQAEARTLGSITLSDSGTPAIAMTAAQLATNILALSAISTPYTITLTNGGTPGLNLAAWQVSSATAAVLSHVSSAYTVSVTGSLTAGNAAALAGNTHLTGTIAVADFGSNVQNQGTALETLFQAGHLGTILLTNNGAPRLSLTASQYAAATDVYAAISSPYALALSVSAAAAATATLPNGRFEGLQVVDTAANITANLAALEPLAANNRILGLTISSGTTAFSLSAATLAANADVFMRLFSGYTISLTDVGTPTLTLQNWQVPNSSSITNLLNAISTPVSVVINGPIRPNVAALFTGLTSKLAPNAISVREFPTNYNEFLPLGSAGLTNYFPQLLTLANAGKLASVDPRNDLPYWSMTTGDATTYASVLALAGEPYVLSEDITVAQIAGAALDSRFANFTIRDTVANVMAGLSSIQGLFSQNLLGRVLFTDLEPRIVTTAATVSTYADVFGVQDVSPYPVLLTDAGTPAITIKGYQLNYTFRQDLLDCIVGPWSLTVNGPLSASTAAVTAAANDAVLTHLTNATVADYSWSIDRYADEIAYLISLGKVTAVTVIDDAPGTITVSRSQLLQDAPLFGSPGTAGILQGNFVLNVIGQWAVDASGDFSDGSHWGGGAVPAATADAVINFADRPAVLHASGTHTLLSLTNTAGNFQLTGGSLIAGALTNASQMQWTGGALVLNAGTTAAVLSNTGTLTLGANGQRLSQTGTAGASFTNSGSILNSLGLGQIDIDAALTNTGAIALNRGTLSFNGGGTSSAGGLLPGGGTIRFGAPQAGSGGAFTVGSGTYAGMDTVVQGGTLDVSGVNALFFGHLNLTDSGILNLGTISGQANNGIQQSSTGGVGPILRGAGTLTVFGGAALMGGAQSGSGDTELIGVSTIGGSFGIDGGRLVRNNGWLNWSSGTIALGAGDTTAPTHAGTLGNAAGATFYVTATNQRISNSGSAMVSNAGVMAFFGGASQIDIDAAVTNQPSGFIQIQSGTLSLNGGGTSDAGHFFVSPGAALRFGAPQTGPGGTYTLIGGTYGGLDTVIQGGTLDASGAGAVFFGQLRMLDSGLLQLGTLNAQTNLSLSQSAGSGSGALIRGTGTFTVYGGANLTGGAQSGSGRTELVGVSTIGGGFGIDGGRMVRNNGWLNWSSGNIALGAGDSTAVTHTGTLGNAAGATFYVTASGGRITVGAGGGTVANAGVMAVYAGNGRVDVDAAVTGGGQIQALSGTLSLNGGGASNGFALIADPTATLRFGAQQGGSTGGTFAVTGGSYGVARTEIAGSTLDLSGAGAATFGTSLVLSSGTLKLGGAFGFADTMQMTGGTLSIGVQMVANSVANLGGGLITGTGGAFLLNGQTTLNGGLSLDGGRVLQNSGRVVWNAGSYVIGGGDTTLSSHAGVFGNAGTAAIDIRGDLAVSGAGSISNGGTLTKSGGTGLSTIQVGVNNSGTLAVTSGTLSLSQAASGGGTFVLDGNATLDLVGGITGGGTLRFLHAGGTLETHTAGLFGAGVTGFANGDVLDAASVLLSAGVTPTLGYTPVAGGGTLTVNDGTHAASFALTGSYVAGSFHLGSDGHGGTAITYG